MGFKRSFLREVFDVGHVTSLLVVDPESHLGLKNLKDLVLLAPFDQGIRCFTVELTVGVGHPSFASL